LFYCLVQVIQLIFVKVYHHIIGWAHRYGFKGDRLYNMSDTVAAPFYVRRLSLPHANRKQNRSFVNHKLRGLSIYCDILMAVIVKKTFTSDKKKWELYNITSCPYHFYYEAFPIAKLLGNEHPELAIKNYVDRSCCKIYEELKRWFRPYCIFQSVGSPCSPGPNNQPIHWQSNTLFINKDGIISLINNSTLPVAHEFKKWFLAQRHDEAEVFKGKGPLFSGSPDPFHITVDEYALIDPDVEKQIKRDKAIVAKQHQQQQRQQRQQHPMVVQNERQRPTRKGTRGCANYKQ